MLGQRGNLLRDPRLNIRMRRDEIEGPSQRACARLMTRKEKDRDLIDHFLGVKPFAGLRICGGHDLGRQIVGRGARRNLVHPCGGQFGDQTADDLGGSFRLTPKAARHPRRQRDERGKVQDRLGALIGAEFVKHLPRQNVVDRDREQRSENHIGGGVAGLFFDLDHTGGQARDRGLGGGDHRGKGIAQASTLKRGVDDAALTFPVRPVGQEHRIPQQRAQALGYPARFRKLHRALF